MQLKSSSVFSSFIVCKNRNRSAPVRELKINNSLFVGQLYEDKSLALRARDLIFFKTDLQTVNYCSDGAHGIGVQKVTLNCNVATLISSLFSLYLARRLASGETFILW